MRVNKPYIFVRIDKKAQREKRETLKKIAGTDLVLYGSPNYAYMARNLQYGEILQVGEWAQRNFPEAQPGDIAIFHHSIEGDMDSIACDRLIDREPDGNEIIYLDGSNRDMNYEVYGIIKSGTNELIPAEQWVFLHTVISRVQKEAVSSLILTEESLQETDEQLRLRLEVLTTDCEKLKNTRKQTSHPEDRGSITRQIDSMYAERERITNFLNSTKFAKATVVAINSRTSKELAGVDAEGKILTVEDYLYPLEVLGHRFLLIGKEDVIGIYN